MKKLVMAIVLMGLAGLAQAYGTPWAVDSLEKAQKEVKQGGTRHLLIFYTSPT